MIAVKRPVNLYESSVTSFGSVAMVVAWLWLWLSLPELIVTVAVAAAAAAAVAVAAVPVVACSKHVGICCASFYCIMLYHLTAAIPFENPGVKIGWIPLEFHWQ